MATMGGFTLRGRWQARGAKGSQKRSITRFTARLSISPPMATTARRSRRRGNWARWRPRPVTHRRLSAVASTFAGDHAGVRDHAQYVLGHPSSLSGKTRINGMFFDQRISSRTMLARTLWLQGIGDQAQDCAQEGWPSPVRSTMCYCASFSLMPLFRLRCGAANFLSQPR